MEINLESTEIPDGFTKHILYVDGKASLARLRPVGVLNFAPCAALVGFQQFVTPDGKECMWAKPPASWRVKKKRTFRVSKNRKRCYWAAKKKKEEAAKE
jgi:hypothetical protein